MHRRLAALLLALAVMLLAPSSAYGQCLLLSPSVGELALSSGYDALSSTIGGGAPAGMTVLTGILGGPFEVSVHSPGAFAAAPAGGGDGVVFGASFTADGVLPIPPTLEGVAALLGLGAHFLQIEAWADRSAGVFPSGDYAMEVTVRCAAA